MTSKTKPASLMDWIFPTDILQSIFYTGKVFKTYFFLMATPGIILDQNTMKEIISFSQNWRDIMNFQLKIL